MTRNLSVPIFSAAAFTRRTSILPAAARRMQEWHWSADYLRTCGEYAQQAGVRLGLEFLNRFEVFLINTSAECRRMVEQVGLDNVGVHYDTHHANIEDPNPANRTAGHQGRDQSRAPE